MVVSKIRKDEDVSKKVPCTLTGPGIDRLTTIYVRPGRVGQQVKKYEDQGKTLRVPASYDLVAELAGKIQYIPEPADTAVSESPAPVKPSADFKPKPERKKQDRKAVICLNTGRFFNNANQLARAYGLGATHVRLVLAGGATNAKGRSMRLATTEEIIQHANGRWYFSGELLPINHSSIRKFKNRPRNAA